MVRPERFELPTFWFVAISGGIGQDSSPSISVCQFRRLAFSVIIGDRPCETLSLYKNHYSAAAVKESTGVDGFGKKLFAFCSFVSYIHTAGGTNEEKGAQITQESHRRSP
jgi:hypothetical protein